MSNKEESDHKPRHSTRATGRSSVAIGGDAAGSVITTGDRNRVRATQEVETRKVVLPPAASVDLRAELAEIRSILSALRAENEAKIDRALADAEEEASKDTPDKAEVGSALKRALDYAKSGADFAQAMVKLGPHITKAVAWLGTSWHHLLDSVGVVI